MKLSLNTIYLGGVSLLFILSLIFTSLAIYEEYKDFENELQTFKQTYIKNKKQELGSTAFKVAKIIKTTPSYKKILNIILPTNLYVKIYKNKKLIYTHSKENPNSITLIFKQKDIKIILKEPLSDLTQLIKKKKELLIHKLIKIMLNFLTLSFIIYMFALWGFYLLNKFLKQEIALFVEFFKDAYQKHKYIKFKDIKIKEFLDIAIYVNKMLKELNKKNKELKELNLKLEEKVKEKTKKLQNLISSQEEFIKTAIHEINTPLTIILTSIDFLDKKDKNVSRIEAAVHMINNIYADLSFVLKYKHKNYPPQIINIKDVLIDRIQFFEMIAKAKKLKINTEIEDFNVFINKEELIRIIDNNISNAIKYSIPKSEIIITAKNNILSFSNKTTEIENINKLFEPFYKEKENSSGFGLGLYLVNEICKKYNIKVDILYKDNIITFKYIFKGNNENSFS